MEVVANGRGDWIGWLELKTEAVNFPEMTKPVHAASDHAAVWADIAL